MPWRFSSNTFGSVYGSGSGTGHRSGEDELAYRSARPRPTPELSRLAPLPNEGRLGEGGGDAVGVGRLDEDAVPPGIEPGFQ